MNILWHLRPRYDALQTSGANLRHWNYTREIAARGHNVFFLLDDYSARDDHARDECLKWIAREIPIAGYFELDSRGGRDGIHLQISRILRDQMIDIYIASLRGRLWLLSSLQSNAVTVADWCDSEVLANLRELKLQARDRHVRGAMSVMRPLMRAVVGEMIYCRRADLSLVASPIDKAWFDRIARAPERTHVIYNGARLAPEPAGKLPNRLIFTGRMDFAPNHQAAMWFIDRVLPLIRAERPDVEFIAAGADPSAELRARDGGATRVVGFVEDLGAEIAASALYVAPMVSGSGFKNKVVEALAHGTFVAGTSMAFEFLDGECRELLLAGDTERELARQVLTFLRNPKMYEDRLERARRLTAESFSWGVQAERLLTLFDAALHARNPRCRGAST